MSNMLTHLTATSTIKRLPAFFAHLVDQFDWYRARFEKLGLNPDDDPLHVLSIFQPLSSADYCEVQEEAIRRLKSEHFLIDHTSGTTGKKKLRVATVRDDDGEATICERFFISCGITSKDRILALDIDSSSIYLFYGKILKRLGVREFLFCSVGAQIETVLQTIEAFNPTILLSIPSVITSILGLIQDRRPRLRMPSLTRAILIGEVLPDTLRAYLQEIYSCESYSFYGSTEIGSVAGECSAHKGLHINQDLSFPSINVFHREQNYLEGEVFWTTLNFVDQPLLLYPTGDIITILLDPCSCGNKNPRITAVRRAHDEIILYGYKIPFETFRNAIRHILGPNDFIQLVLMEQLSGYILVFRVSATLSSRIAELYPLLTQVDDVPYFIRRRLLTCHVQFADKPLRVGRKTPNVLVRRPNS